MTLDGAIVSLLDDTVTIEPFVSQDTSQAPTYGAAVTYPAQVLPWVERTIDAQGREFRSSAKAAKVIIPDRLAVDPRSRITLPAGFVPNQPPIRAVRPNKGLGLDHTEIVLVLLLSLLYVGPCLAQHDSRDGGLPNAKTVSDGLLGQTIPAELSNVPDLVGGELRKAGALTPGRVRIARLPENVPAMDLVLAGRDVLQVFGPVVGGVAIDVVDLHAVGAGPDERGQDNSMDEQGDRPSLVDERGGAVLPAASAPAAPRQLVPSDESRPAIGGALASASERTDLVKALEPDDRKPSFVHASEAITASCVGGSGGLL